MVKKPWTEGPICEKCGGELTKDEDDVFYECDDCGAVVDPKHL